MKRTIRRAISHPLISGSAIIVIGSTFANIFNYLYNLFMGRFLSVEEYGILAALISLFNIFFVFSATITTVFTKFTASFVGQDNRQLVGTLIKKGNFYIGGIGFFVTCLMILFGAKVGQFLNITNTPLIYIIGISLFFNFLYSLANGVLQGLLKFFSFSIVFTIASLLKFVLGFLFIFAGLRLFGAVFAILLSSILGWIVALIPLLKEFKNKNEKHLHIPNFHKEISFYALPVFLTNVGLTMLTSVDILLVKHFFNELIAGQYAALSLMGRSIFFIVSPITFVFFPLIAQKKERKESLTSTFLLSVFIIGIPCLFLSIFYFLFPNVILHIFFPAKGYASLAPYLGPFSIFILIYSFCFFLNSYFLSVGRTKVYLLTLGGAFLQIVYIFVFHKSIPQVIRGITLVSFLLLISLLVYYFRTKAPKWKKSLSP